MSLLVERWPALQAHLPRRVLVHGPTPVRRLPLPTGAVDVWLKDDSLAGQLYGGNKVRKLEWTIADALERKHKTIVTVGGLATNHGLATALYARDHGLRTVLLLVDQPSTPHTDLTYRAIRATGAVVIHARSPLRAAALVPWALARYADPLPPTLLPVGGSSPLGVLGFVEAALELAGQVAAGELPAPRRIVIAVGSGGSAAGLLLGLRMAGLDAEVHGVLVNDKTPVTADKIVRLARRAERLLLDRGAVLRPASLDGLVLDKGWLGQGYGHATFAGARATEVFAAHDVTLDPVYTAKAAACLLDLAERTGEGPLLFWQTFNGRPLYV